VSGGGHEEEHPGRLGPRVEEGVRASGRNKHETSRSAPEHRVAGPGLPRAPVVADAGAWVEGEQVKFAFQDVEDLLGLLIQLRPVEHPDMLMVLQVPCGAEDLRLFNRIATSCD